MINNNDLIELCKILAERNALQVKRHSVRFKHNRLSTIYSKLLREDRHKRLLRCMKREAKADNSSLTLYYSERINDEFKYFKFNDYPKKYKTMKRSELRIKVAQLNIDNQQCKLDILKFTQKTHEKVMEILKRNNWELSYDAHSAYVKSVRRKGMGASLVAKYEDIFVARGKEKIAEIATWAKVDDILLGKGS